MIGEGTSYSNNVGPLFNTVEIYDPHTDTWTTPSWSESTMPTARKELGAALDNNDRIYAIGGANGAYICTNEEASIMLPENIPPIAYIDSVTPNPATHGQQFPSQVMALTLTVLLTPIVEVIPRRNHKHLCNLQPINIVRRNTQYTSA